MHAPFVPQYVLMSCSLLITTAGYSRRMGQAKAWLLLDGRALVQQILDKSAEAGVMHATIVVGSKESKDTSLVSEQSLWERLSIPCEMKLKTVVANPDGHLIDSIRSSLRVIPSEHSILLWPVDSPFASPELVKEILAQGEKHANHVVIPSHRQKRGHPVFFDQLSRRYLKDRRADHGVHLILRDSSTPIIEVPTQDRRIAAPLNTPEEAKRLGIILP